MTAAEPAARPATFAEMRDEALNEVLAAFGDSDPARALRHVAHAAFLRGAWAGRAAESSTEIFDLAAADRAAVMARLDASRVEREQHS